MLAYAAHHKKLISERQETWARSRAQQVGLIVAVLLTVTLAVTIVWPLHQSRIAATHGQYRDRYGVVTAPPILLNTFGVSQHYLVKVRYVDWSGRAQTLEFMTEDRLTPGQRQHIVVSRSGPPWIEGELGSTAANPLNSSNLDITLGAIVLFMIGLPGFLAVTVGFESLLVHLMVRARQKGKPVRAAQNGMGNT